MEVRKGFKQTEAGIIPEDWAIKKLGEISTISSGGTPSRQMSSYWGGDIPWITTTQIDFNVIKEANEFITKEGMENSAAKICKSGTLLMAMYGQGKTRGKIAKLGIDATINQACAAIKLNGVLFSDYIFLNLSSRYEEIRSLSNIGNQENLNSQIISNVFIPIPPLPEQHAIAAALSDVDALLNSLDALIAKKRSIKQGAMQELLTGKKRLPGFSGEWEVSTLKQVADIQAGINKSISSMGSGTLYVTVQELYEGTSIPVRKLGRIQLTQKEIEAKSLIKGDIVFGKSSVKREGIGYPNQFLGWDEPAVFSGFTFRARAYPEIVNPVFLFYILRWQNTRRWLIDNSQASALTNINQSIANNIPISYPSVTEQTAIAEILSDMDAEISALEQKREKTRLLKQGMMQELLTGRIRLL